MSVLGEARFCVSIKEVKNGLMFKLNTTHLGRRKTEKEKVLLLASILGQ